MANNINAKLCLEWANSLLAEVNMAVTILTDFQEASVLSLLVDLLWPVSQLRARVQAMSAESNLKQIHVVLDHLQTLKVKHSVSPEGLINGESTSLLDLMWALMLHLCIHTPKISPFQRNVKMGQRSVLNWCRQELPYMCVDHMDTLTNNVCHDGMLIDLLCHFCSVEHDPDPVQYLRNCLKAAQDEFSISENILEPVAVIEGSENEMSLLIYLALLRRKVKQKPQGQVGSDDSRDQKKLDGVSTQSDDVRPCDSGHTDQSSAHNTETNTRSQSGAGVPCCYDNGTNRSCHGDGVTRGREHGYDTCPKSHCCSIWCGDDDAELLGAVVMATDAQSQKRLHKIGQVVLDVDSDSNSNEGRESIEASLEIGGPTDESSHETHMTTFSIDNDQGHDLQPHSDTDSGVMAHRDASESESGIESNWGNSRDLSCDVCEGEGHFTCVGDVVVTNGSVSQKTSVTQGEDTLRDDEDFGSDADTTLDDSDDDDNKLGWTRVCSPDSHKRSHTVAADGGGDENVQDPSYVYTSKIYVTLSAADQSDQPLSVADQSDQPLSVADQSDQPLREPVTGNGDGDCGLVRQKSLFDEIQQVEINTLGKVESGREEEGEEEGEEEEEEGVGKSGMSYSETFGLELSGPVTGNDKDNNICCHGYTEAPRDLGPVDGQTELDVQKLPEGDDNKHDYPETDDNKHDYPETDPEELPDESGKEDNTEEECRREEGEARYADSMETVTDLSYEDSYEESVRDVDTEDCGGSAELSDSETMSIHNVVEAIPQCTAPPEPEELRVNLGRDIMVDEVSVVSDDPSDWMEASMNSLIASANRDWLQQNILSESAQSRNEEFAALQKALMMRTIQCVVSEQLSLGNMGQTVAADDPDVYFVSGDDAPVSVPPNLCPTGSDELLHLLDMIGMQGQEMRKELVMSQTREAYLQEEILNEDEQLVEVVDGLHQELSSLKEDNEKLHDELLRHKVLKSQLEHEVESLKGVVRRLCGHIENLEVEVAKMHEDMVPRQVTKNAAILTEVPCRFNFATQTEVKVNMYDAECQVALSEPAETVDDCVQTMPESPVLNGCHGDNGGEKMSTNMTAMIDKILQQMANMTGRSSVSPTPIHDDDTDTDDTWRENEESDSDATVQVMKEHLSNAMLQYDLTKSELERKNSVLQHEVESSTSSVCDLERELKKAREENDVLRVLTEGDKAEMDILKDKIAMMEKAVSSAQNVNERLNLRLETTLNEVSMTMPTTTGGNLREKLAEMEAEKKELEQTILEVREEYGRAVRTVTDLQRSVAECEGQKDRLWTEVKVLLDEYGLLKAAADTMENLLQQHLPEIYGSVVIRGKRHGHVLVRSLSELKEHVFGEQKLSESSSGCGGGSGSGSLHNALELSLHAPRAVPSTVATIHENIMKQSELVLSNIDPGIDDGVKCGPVVSWQDVCQSIASELVSESAGDVAARVPLDTAKVMPLFDRMLKVLDIPSGSEVAGKEPPLCLPKQVLGLAKTMETELDVRSTNGSTQSVNSTTVKTDVDDRSSTVSDHSVDTEKVNREYEELKKKRLHLLIQAYTGNPDPDGLIARARGQVGVPAHSLVEPPVVTSARELEAMRKLEASRARMYAMKEKLRLGQPLYHIPGMHDNDVHEVDASQSLLDVNPLRQLVPEADASQSLLEGNSHRQLVPGADASQSLLDANLCRRLVLEVEADTSQSLLDVNSRRRLVEAMSAQEMAPPVVQRQSMVWKKTIAPSNENTRPSCYFSAPLMSSSPRGERSYADGAQRQSLYKQRHRQIYPHKKGYKTAEQYADGNFVGDVECSSYADLMMENGLKYPHGNGDVWSREKRCVPSAEDGESWTQGNGENCEDAEYDSTLNKSAESLASQLDDDVYNWRRSRQMQSCWNLTNTSRGVTSRRVMPIANRCQSLTLHSQSLVDISSRQVLTDASDTESRLDTSARSATELHCTDTSLQESEHTDTSVYSEDSPHSHTQHTQHTHHTHHTQPPRHPDNVYHVQERYREDRDSTTERPTFERAREERLKTYTKHDNLAGGYGDKSQQGHQDFSQQGHQDFSQQGHQDFSQQGHQDFSQQGHQDFSQQGHQDFLADDAPKPGNANWTSYYQRRCRALKSPTEDVVTPQFVSKDVRNGDNVSGGDEGTYTSRLVAREREHPRQAEQEENIRATRTVSEPRGKSAFREPYDSPKCGNTQTNSPGYSRGDSPKTVTFSDGDTRRRLIYPDRRAPREALKTTTSTHVTYPQNREDKSSDTNARSKNRCWDDDADAQTIRTSYTGSWRDKEEDVDDDVLREPPNHVSGPLKEQHIQMLNARRLSVHRDDDSSTSMSDVDFVVMRSGDIVRRRKKAKARKKDAPETSTRGATAGQLVNNDRGIHPDLDIIAEGKKCLEEEQDYLGDYRSLQLVSGAAKAENGDWSELKTQVGFSSSVRPSKDPNVAESKRLGVSKSVCINEKTVAAAMPVKRSAAAALQLERDLVAAGRLMEEIEKCKMVGLPGDKRQGDAITDDKKSMPKTDVVTTASDAKLEFGDRQKRGVYDKKKSLSSIVECPSDSVTEKERGDVMTSSEMTENVPDVPDHKGPVLTEDQKKYANDLIDKYAHQWEQTRIQLQPPVEQVLSKSNEVKVVETPSGDDKEKVKMKVKESTSGDTSEVAGHSKANFEVDEIVTRYNQEWLTRQQVVTAGGDQ